MKVSRDKPGAAPRLPNERDESADSTRGGVHDPRLDKAVEDVKRGNLPTDKSTESDEVYRRTLRDEVPGAERDTGPER